MKIYEWKETETHYIAYMRPKELFDLSTMQKPNPEDHEARLLAKHIFTGEMEGFARAYGKGWRQDFAKAHANSLNELYLEEDTRNLEVLRSQSRHRKTA